MFVVAVLAAAVMVPLKRLAKSKISIAKTGWEVEQPNLYGAVKLRAPCANK